MDKKGGKNTLFPLSGLLILLTAVRAFLCPARAPLRELRPDVKTVPEAARTVQARFWQDPLLAIIEAPKSADDKSLVGVLPDALIGDVLRHGGKSGDFEVLCSG